ncbi:MAG: heparinase II/III family protein [Planctomycetota bacterium]|nr:heparinase II/III family protein [Planctomycetota bacterium]
MERTGRRHLPKIKEGHPRLWLAPGNLAAVKRAGRGFRRPWRDIMFRTLEKYLHGPDMQWAFRDIPRDHSLSRKALALGVAWRLAGDRRYDGAARRLLEALEEYVGRMGGSYDAWGEAAEAAAYLYDWFHDHWERAGIAGDVARCVALFGRRAMGELLDRYILDDWHNYSLGLQSGVLAAALAIGRDYPSIEDGTMLRTMWRYHFAGFRTDPLKMQDFHRPGPTVHCLDRALRADDGAGFCCLWESTGGYHHIDAWECIKMAELWTHATDLGDGGPVWPELTAAGEALLLTIRPDGRIAVWGDTPPYRVGRQFTAMMLMILHARTPRPDFAALLRECGTFKDDSFPVHQLLCAPPDATPSRHPGETAGDMRGAVPVCRSLPLATRVGPLLLLRSDWSDSASLVMFRCGRHFGWHNHLDHNCFTVFRRGALAVDSGGGHYDTSHRPCYAMRTIAHNGILVRDPSEESWPGRYSIPVSNDGGQRLVTLSHQPPNDATGGPHAPLTEERAARLADEFEMSRLLAFEARPDRMRPELVYAAGDATRAYTYPWSGKGTNPSRRVEEAVRQIVYVPPDWLIVFDRVEATRAHFGKKWLLHSIEPPAVVETGGELTRPEAGISRLPSAGPFVVEHGEGRLTIWPLLPEAHRVRAVGGDGYEFWVDGAGGRPGMNYPPSGGHGEVGGWRLEISPARSSVRDCFLTAIHIGLRDEPVEEHPWDAFRPDVRRERGFAVLRILSRERGGRPILSARFREEGPVEVAVERGGFRIEHYAPSPSRVPRGR